ncbi:DoxX family protein [Ancylobacter lacus]|uniref:DoxX family protein n=1 Tax=Ancylobacter lacus TaxID=2579970 RepID=UPI001BD18F99|nr:DoxX family protein [Ancylobacter lacus]MBS7538875.1 DoxX family protein [Ancylobacter lacus]
MSLIAPTPSAASRGWNLALWIGQLALGLLYLMGVWMHLALSPQQMAAMGAVWALGAPLALVRFIGVMELLGVLGLILPAATRILPGLTVWAAAGLLAIQALAIPFHILRGEVAPLPFNLVYVALCLFVLWGRTRKAPIAPR